MDQVALLARDVRDCLGAREAAGAVLVDQATACDAVWYCGLTLWLLRMLPGGHVVPFIGGQSRAAALCSGAVAESGAGCADLGAVSPRDLSWPHCCSVSTSMASLVPSLGGMAVPVAWPSLALCLGQWQLELGLVGQSQQSSI